MLKRFDSHKHHRRSIRLMGYDYSQTGGYFVTICAWQRECLFGEVVEGEVRLSEVGKIVAWEWRRLGEGFSNVELGEFVVMPNHVHGIIFIHAAERATRYEQNLIMEEDCRMPDEAGIGIVGSPVHIDGANVGATHPALSMPNSGTARDLNIAHSDTDGSPMRGQDDAPDMENSPASPRRGQDDAMDMEFPAGDVESDAAERATRHEQNLPIYDDHPLPDKAIEDIVGSPLRGPGGPPPQSLGAMIGQWKSRVTKRAWKLPGMQGRPIWLRNYYEHIIRDEADLRRIEEYIQNNPRRWEQDQLHPQAAPNKFNQDR